MVRWRCRRRAGPGWRGRCGSWPSSDWPRPPGWTGCWPGRGRSRPRAGRGQQRPQHPVRLLRRLRAAADAHRQAPVAPLALVGLGGGGVRGRVGPRPGAVVPGPPGDRQPARCPGHGRAAAGPGHPGRRRRRPGGAGGGGRVPGRAVLRVGGICLALPPLATGAAILRYRRWWCSGWASSWAGTPAWPWARPPLARPRCSGRPPGRLVRSRRARLAQPACCCCPGRSTTPATSPACRRWSPPSGRTGPSTSPPGSPAPGP
jgi:hypothetical protein